MFPSEDLRRQAVRALARVGGPALLLFCVVDDHVHVVVLCDDDRVGVLARSLLLALRPLAGPGISPAHVRPVQGRSHLMWLVGYCLAQPSKHRIGAHPALWSGSCFLDLVGARVLPGYAPPLREALPRLRGRVCFEHVGLPARPLQPLDDDALREVTATALVAAASAALAAPPDLPGNSALVVTCRRAVAQLGKAAGFTAAQLARALRIQPNAVRRLARAPVPPGVLPAVRRRLALEARVAGQPMLVAEAPMTWGPAAYEINEADAAASAPAPEPEAPAND
ncbi:MAG: hypothetical protein D6798_16865 [Deltaproteobacteria bacterium]|nr:MAG: hypothetical protein D6798_16865 [Deltaproteobacteria bacterium]